MKEKKNPMSCFDDNIGDDFLSAWKPSKMNSLPNIDFECTQRDGPEKTFKLPDNFDLDMDFGTQSGLKSKLSSFDIDLDFLKSPKRDDLAKEKCGEPQKTESQTSRDTIHSNPDHDATFLPVQGRENLVSKSRNVEEKSTIGSQNQVAVKATFKAADSEEAYLWGSQMEKTRLPADSNCKNEVLKETSKDPIKEIVHDCSFSSYPGFQNAEEKINETKQTDRELCKDIAADQLNLTTAAGQSPEVQAAGLDTEVQKLTKQGDLLPSADRSAIFIVQNKAGCKVVKETLPNSARNVDLPIQKGIPTKSVASRILHSSQEAARPATQKRQLALSLRKTNEDKNYQLTTTEHMVRNNNVIRPNLPLDKVSHSFLAKHSNKLNVLNSSSPLAAIKSTTPKQKHNLSTSFRGLKPTQVSALRTSRSQALQPVKAENQIGDPPFTAGGDELRTTLEAQANVQPRSSLQSSRSPPTSTALSKKRGPPSKEQSADAQAIADVSERPVNEEAPEKRPKLQSAQRTERESNQLKLLNAGGEKTIPVFTPIPTMEMTYAPKNAPQTARKCQIRPDSSFSRLPMSRLQETDPAPTSVTRIELPSSEDLFPKPLCARSSPSHGQEIERATPEVDKKPTSTMNHEPETIDHHAQKKFKKLDPKSLLKDSRKKFTDVMIHRREGVKNTEHHKIDGSKGSQSRLKDSRVGCTDEEMHRKTECDKVIEVCPQLLIQDIMGQTCTKETRRDGNLCKTTAYYSVELDKIMSMLKQKQRRANDLLAEAMAHNAKMKHLMDSKNQEKIMTLQKSIAERLEAGKMQAVGNRAKRCEWCEVREGKVAGLIKEHCNTVH